MVPYSIDKISSITGGVFIRFCSNAAIDHLLFDSRKVFSPSASLFFALKGPRRNGHRFIPELYKKESKLIVKFPDFTFT